MLLCIENPTYRTKSEASRFRQLTYTCLETMKTHTNETVDFPIRPCKVGFMVNVRFPTCGDGVNLDSPDHMAHVIYPYSGTFKNSGPCPTIHPIKIRQLFFETTLDTTMLMGIMVMIESVLKVSTSVTERGRCATVFDRLRG
jgi:K+-transporting ATPase A subunit